MSEQINFMSVVFSCFWFLDKFADKCQIFIEIGHVLSLKRTMPFLAERITYVKRIKST